jgi:hypothetical protein
LFGQLTFQLTCQLLYVGGLAESLHPLARGFHVNARTLAQFLQHLNHHRKLLLGKHAHLQVGMRAPLGFASHSVLAYQHHDREEHALRGEQIR